MTHTWKIGEYCAGGIITAVTNNKQIILIQKDWDMSKGTRRSSDQKNAEELDRLTVEIDNSNRYRVMYEWLTTITTSYYADEVIKWVESKVPKARNQNHFW